MFVLFDWVKCEYHSCTFCIIFHFVAFPERITTAMRGVCYEYQHKSVLRLTILNKCCPKSEFGEFEMRYRCVWVGQVVVSQKGCFEKNSSAWTEHPPHPILKRKSMKNLFYPYNLFGEFRSWNSQFAGKKKMRKWKMAKNQSKDIPDQGINWIIEIFVIFSLKQV